jgi:large subunit ribosomal protein L31
MKANLHPAWHNDTTVTCSCGNSFQTGSTLEKIQVDLCSACHPYFTGEMKFIDVQGRVEKFQAKWQKAQSYQATKKAKKAAKKPTESKSLKDMLQNLKAQKQAAKAAAN